MTCPTHPERTDKTYCLDCSFCLQGFCDWPMGWFYILKSSPVEEGKKDARKLANNG